MKKYSIRIIGYGNVGKFIERQAKINNVEVQVFSRESFVKNNDLLTTEVIFITTHDRSIKSIANLLVEWFGDKLSGKYIIHCSGANNKEILDTCQKQNAKIVAAHPFMTITSEFNGEGVTWGIDCNEEDFLYIDELISLLNGRAVYLSKKNRENKIIYHIVSVIVSNYISGCIKLAFDISKAIDLDVESFLYGIVKETTNNCLISLKSGKKQIDITGPISRGDITTIERHLEGLREYSEFDKPYRLFGLGLLEILKNSKKINEEDYLLLEKLLQNKNNDNKI